MSSRLFALRLSLPAVARRRRVLRLDRGDLLPRRRAPNVNSPEIVQCAEILFTWGECHLAHQDVGRQSQKIMLSGSIPNPNRFGSGAGSNHPLVIFGEGDIVDTQTELAQLPQILEALRFQKTNCFVQSAKCGRRRENGGKGAV